MAFVVYRMMVGSVGSVPSIRLKGGEVLGIL